MIPPQPFAPRGRGRFARVRARHLAVPSGTSLRSWLPSESFAFYGAFLANRQIGFGRVRIALRSLLHRCVGFGGGIPRGWRWRVRACRWRPRLPPRRPSGLVRPPHPPDAGHPARRSTAFAAWPRPGGADGRPAVREALGRASAPVPPLRARGTTFGSLYDAAARRLHLPSGGVPPPCNAAASTLLPNRDENPMRNNSKILVLATREPSSPHRGTNALRLDMRLSVERLSGPCARTG